jgi:hypothetical protein
MQQREGLTETIHCGPADDLESHALVKAHGLVVLLIHIHPGRAQRLDSIGEQTASNSLAAPLRMDE